MLKAKVNGKWFEVGAFYSDEFKQLSNLNMKARNKENEKTIWQEYLDHCSFMMAIGMKSLSWIDFRLLISSLENESKAVKP